MKRCRLCCKICVEQSVIKVKLCQKGFHNKCENQLDLALAKQIHPLPEVVALISKIHDSQNVSHRLWTQADMK